MQEFIARENLKLFQSKLAETIDPTERERLLRLIEEESARLGKVTGSKPDDPR